MPHLIIDLEMSGSKVGYHDLIQIGAVIASDNWAILSEFESLVYPDNEEAFTEYSEEVHGITLEDLEDAPMSYEVIENLEAWLRKSLKRKPDAALTDVVLCGQSVINDINFLKQKYDELNLDWSFSYKLIDLLSFTYLFYKIWDVNGIPHPSRYSLQTVAEHFGIFRKEENHNALEDAKMTYECFKKYFEITNQIRIVGK